MENPFATARGFHMDSENNWRMQLLDKRKISPAYVIFYIIFLPDTYRVLFGLTAAWLLAPSVIASQPLTFPGKAMIWIMLVTIGYAVTGVIGNKIAGWARRLFLKDRVK